MYEQISYEDAKKLNMTLIDMRTKREYDEFHIPGAINFPILDEEERALVGTLYKNGDYRDAKIRAIRYASEKLIPFENLIGDDSKKFCLYCQRGGYRSRAISALFYALSYKVFQLSGGIKGYRQMINENLEKKLESLRLITIYGKTGTGKTDILNILEKRGIPVLDLEKMANHKGSVLGSLGMGEPNSQKMFEALLYEELKKYDELPVFVTEGESRRIGKVIQPEKLYEALTKSKKIYLTSPMEIRVKRLTRGYTEDVPLEEQKEALKRLEPYIGKSNLNEIYENLDAGRFEEACRIICERHYDNHYNIRAKSKEDIIENIDDEITADKIIKIYDEVRDE